MPWDGSLFGYAPGVNAVGVPPGSAPPAAPGAPAGAPGSQPGVTNPTPAPQQGTPTPQELAQFVQQLLSHGGQGGGNNPAPGSGGNGSANFGPNRGINLGPWGAGALQAASTLAPFPYGLPFTAAQLAMRGYNLANGDAVRTSLGGQPQDLGQILGGLFNLNDRASLTGNQTFFNRQENKDVNGNPVAVTQGGYYDPSFLQRMFTGDQAGTAYTPEEKRLRDIAAVATHIINNKQTGFQDMAVDAYGNPVGGGYNPSGNGGNNAGGSNPGVGSGGYGAYGNPLGAGGNNQNGGMM